MTYEVTRWLPTIVKAVAGTFSAWSLSRRQAASTKQAVLRALFMWTGNDIGHANWWTHIYHASARVGQLILKQGLNIQVTENEIMSCDVNIQKICLYICYSTKHECFDVLNVFMTFHTGQQCMKTTIDLLYRGYFRRSLIFCVTNLSASFSWFYGPPTCHVITAATCKMATFCANTLST